MEIQVALYKQRVFPGELRLDWGYVVNSASGCSSKSARFEQLIVTSLSIDQIEREQGRLHYNPQKETALFCEFVELDTDEEIAGFAKHWGFLHGNDLAAAVITTSPDSQSVDQGALHYAEPISLWLDGIRWLKAAWETAMLRRVVEARAITLYRESRQLVDAEIDEIVAEAADGLAGHIGSRLPEAAKLEFGLAEGGGIALQVVPKSLEGVLWLQLCAAIAANRGYRQCDNPDCLRWFEVSGEERGSKRKYCSDPCRAHTYYLQRKTSKAVGKNG